MGREPGEQIINDLSPVGLVEHLMAGARIKPQFYLPESGCAQAALQFFQSATVTDRVCVTTNDQQRQVGSDGAQFAWAANCQQRIGQAAPVMAAQDKTA